jgi:hypothetical protein
MRRSAGPPPGSLVVEVVIERSSSAPSSAYLGSVHPWIGVSDRSSDPCCSGRFRRQLAPTSWQQRVGDLAESPRPRPSYPLLGRPLRAPVLRGARAGTIEDRQIDGHSARLRQDLGGGVRGTPSRRDVSWAVRGMMAQPDRAVTREMVSAARLLWELNAADNLPTDPEVQRVAGLEVTGKDVAALSLGAGSTQSRVRTDTPSERSNRPHQYHRRQMTSSAAESWNWTGWNHVVRRRRSGS